MDITGLLKRHEGLRLKPYRDTVGKLTIGIGRNIEDLGISEEEAEMLLSNDLEWVRAGLDQKHPWWTSLDEVRQAVLMDMAFNLGHPRFAKFKNMFGALRRKAYEIAAYEMLDSKWAKQVGGRAEELAWMMRTGEWPNGE